MIDKTVSEKYIKTVFYKGYEVEVLFNEIEKRYFGKILNIDGLVCFQTKDDKDYLQTVFEIVDEYINMLKETN